MLELGAEPQISKEEIAYNGYDIKLAAKQLAKEHPEFIDIKFNDLLIEIIS
jgi:hypothetical protein